MTFDLLEASSLLFLFAIITLRPLIYLRLIAMVLQVDILFDKTCILFIRHSIFISHVYSSRGGLSRLISHDQKPLHTNPFLFQR